MDLKRTISVCLLVVYGLPAIVGPYWHQHGHSCVHCDSLQTAAVPASPNTTEQESAAKPTKPRRFGSCDGECCVHRHPSSKETSPSEQPGETDDCQQTDHRGHCVVCDFYAKAYFAQVVVELPVLTVALPLYAEPTTQVPFCQAISPIARGPPSAC